MNWSKFREYYLNIPELGFSLDISRMSFGDDFLSSMEAKMQEAFKAMKELESGVIANPDENRMVGHYWLRNADLAPNAELTADIKATLAKISDISSKVHSGEIKAPAGNFTDLLVIGIGGSALGPQFVAEALGGNDDKLKVHFFDNTDPDGMDRVIAQIGGDLKTTLSVVISKSGGTPETRNGMLEAQAAYQAAGLDFSKQAIAVTGTDSKLDKVAAFEGWIARLPMWDWVGGRTSETGPVGLLPAALQGLDIDGMIEGAAKMDEATRIAETKKNPAALLALMWYYATDGKGSKDMVVLPYKDRLMLFSKYLQQLIMESIGKEFDLQGNKVNQGISVYGNKGSTDQHAYVQQLREGVANFFVTFIEVLKDRKEASIEVEEGTTAGDYLQGFLLGTREALAENDRDTMTITIDDVTPQAVGMLIALYERAVGFYATLVGINAYHQPGVEAGKKAAAGILALKSEIHNFLKANAGTAYTVEAIAEGLGKSDSAELVFKLVRHMASNEQKSIVATTKCCVFSTTYEYKA
jgi:glucose-6-phosphate isomerase